MWNEKKVSLIFPTYNEKDSIKTVIEEFFASGCVDEIIVVDNNAAPGTVEEVLKTKARLVHEPRQGYGYAIQRGFRETSGDYVIVAEPDGTFSGKDVLKLLVYADDVDVVYGTRTHREFIWSGTNMQGFLRWGNWAVAKMIELLFNTVNLSDVGCTMRLIRREGLVHIQRFFAAGGNHFGLEMMLLSMIHSLRIVQIPVSYLPRVGTSSVTGDPLKAVILGLRMIWLVLEYRAWSAVQRMRKLPCACGEPYR
jgi:glycosyltransferase involved in cell wall biosynthesis